MRAFVLLLAILGFSTTVRAQDAAPPPITVAEASEYRQTGTSQDVEAFLRSLHQQSERTWLGSIGTSLEDRDLPLLVVADPPVRSPEEARRSGKLVVLLFGNIHSGETCGKEALQMLARELALGARSALLDDLIVCFVPNYNPDGNDRMAADNRPGQVGPESMGTRSNAQGLDLNRDWIKMEAPETRALVRFMRQWDPAVIVDSHTTNGSHHRYTLTYQGPKHPAGDPALIEFARDTLLPEIDERFEAQSGYHAFIYGNFANGHTAWTTYPASPRYGAAYRGLRNRISILSEAYAYATFEDRVRATLEFCRAVLQESAEHKSAIERAIRAADRFNREGGTREIALRTRAIAFPNKVEVLGYEEYNDRGERIEVTDQERTYEVELINDFQATLSIERPWGYLIPPTLGHVVTHLRRHGIELREVRERMDLDAQVYRLDRIRRADREFQGHRMLDIADVTRRLQGVTIEPGWVLVPTDQDLGNLAAYMLEPQATDGLASWNFLDDHLAEGQDFPILRVAEPLPILTRSAKPLPEDQGTRTRFTADMVIHRRNAPNLNGDGRVRLSWSDDGHFEKSVPGIDGRFRVHAMTGRVLDEQREHDWQSVARVIGKLPTIDGDLAERIARSQFRYGREDAYVFEHELDLYYVSPDGDEAFRLTASPEREEVWSLSPDGRFVAFVKSDDLWVVDVDTRTPRALTTGGGGPIRHGKASWLYFEELFGRNWRAYWWSPDSKHIAFLMTDSSNVPEYTIVDNQRREQVIEVERYARPGEPNPDVALGMVSPSGGNVRTVDLSQFDDGLFLISHVSWTPDSANCVVHVQNRIQTWLDVLHANPRNGRVERILRDQTQAWITSPRDFAYLKDGSFLMFSDRDGYRHLYHYTPEGRLIRQVTQGEWDCRQLLKVDEEAGWLYFMGSLEGSIASDLGKIRLDGSDLTLLTTEPGSHSVSLNPSATMFIDSWSTMQQPTRMALRSTEDGALIRWLDTNPVHELDEVHMASIEHVRIPTRHDDIELEGILHFPPDFDAAGSYPIWLLTYAGPGAATVRDSWQSGRSWEQLLCAAGIVVLRVDPYPASGKGAQSAWTTYRNMGVRELQDLEDAVDWVLEHDWADASRVGISGHSFGGYITAYALTHSTRFSAGIAGAPVTDWRDYDTIYTERYMSTPQDNPEGYIRTSAVEGARNLHGRLLIAHGTIDDNVHLQNSILLIAALQRANKMFEMAIYPGSRHGIWSLQYRMLQWDFIKRTMGVEDPSAEMDIDPAPSPSDPLDGMEPAQGPSRGDR